MSGPENELERFGSLHDLQLVGIRLDWAAGVAELGFEDHDGSTLTLVVSGLSAFDLQRTSPWGPSSFVDEARVERSPSGAVRIRLEMQSGDAIVAFGAGLDVQGQRSPDRDPSALAVDSVRYPDGRANLIEGLRAIVDLGPDAKHREDLEQRWPGLREGINWIDDNVPEPTAQNVGTTLRTLQEAELIQAVYDAWAAVLDETAGTGGRTSSDLAHVSASTWPILVSAASAARAVLKPVNR